MREYIKIPQERMGILIGPNGEVRKRLEELSGCKLRIESRDGDITIDKANATDPLAALNVGSVIKAIGRGFTPEEAYEIFRDDKYFKLVDIRDWIGKKKKTMLRIRARLIGTDGKIRKRIEAMSGARVCVYGTTVAIIGDLEEMEAASVAIEMLLNGSELGSVNRFLEKKRKQRALQSWL